MNLLLKIQSKLGGKNLYGSLLLVTCCIMISVALYYHELGRYQPWNRGRYASSQNVALFGAGLYLVAFQLWRNYRADQT
jgi:hypothetical protein